MKTKKMHGRLSMITTTNRSLRAQSERKWRKWRKYQAAGETVDIYTNDIDLRRLCAREIVKMKARGRDVISMVTEKSSEFALGERLLKLGWTYGVWFNQFDKKMGWTYGFNQ